MKRLVVLSVVMLAAIGAGASSGVATAQNLPASVTPFGPVSYTDKVFGPVTCSGINIFWPGIVNKDVEACTAWDGFPAGTYVNQFGGWTSDSRPPSHSAGLHTTRHTEVVTDNGDGTSHIAIVAYY